MDLARHAGWPREAPHHERSIHSFRPGKVLSVLGPALAVATLLVSLRSPGLLPEASATPAKGLSPAALAAAPDGTKLYLACSTGDRMLVLDLAARKVTQSIATPLSPTGLAIAPDGKTLWVTCAAPKSEVCAIELPRARITRRLPAGHTALAPVPSLDGPTLFVCNRFNDDVAVLDLPLGKGTAPHPCAARAPVDAGQPIR